MFASLVGKDAMLASHVGKDAMLAFLVGTGNTISKCNVLH